MILTSNWALGIFTNTDVASCNHGHDNHAICYDCFEQIFRQQLQIREACPDVANLGSYHSSTALRTGSTYRAAIRFRYLESSLASFERAATLQGLL
jgi:hypothetical protein